MDKKTSQNPQKIKPHRINIHLVIKQVEMEIYLAKMTQFFSAGQDTAPLSGCDVTIEQYSLHDHCHLVAPIGMFPLVLLLALPFNMHIDQTYNHSLEFTNTHYTRQFC